MSEYALLIDHKRCYDCHTCEVACKQEHDIAVGINWIKVVTVGPRQENGTLTADYIPMTCRHCAQAPCITACPVKGALTKRPSGAVVVEPSVCIGCMSCADACPFHAIVMDPVRQVAAKCDLCSHLIETGRKPACVKHCPSGCLQFGPVNETVGQRRAAKAHEIAQGN